jgi:drug/metabolite transporter (DMT)-like permease
MAAIDPARTEDTSLPFAALLVGGFAFGASPILVRLADISPLASGFFRLALALPALWLIGRLTPQGEDAGPMSSRDRKLLAITGVVFGIDIIFWHLSLFYTSVADATLISNTSPIMVAIGAFLLFGETMTRRFMGGLALALLGVCSLALQKVGGTEPLNRLLGDLLAIGAAVSYAVYLLFLRNLRQRLGAQRILIGSTAVSALVLLPAALLYSPAMIPSSAQGWLIVMGLAFFSQVSGQLLTAYALAHLPAVFSSLTQFVMAGVAAIAAWAIFGEEITMMKLASAAAILIGIMLCRAPSARSGQTASSGRTNSRRAKQLAHSLIDQVCNLVGIGAKSR